MITTVFAVNIINSFGNFDGSLPWGHNSADMQNFSEITRDIGTVLMGRKTYESLLSRVNIVMNPPLKRRNIIVLTSEALELGEIAEADYSGRFTGGWSGEKVYFMNSDVPSALAYAERRFPNGVAVIGGAGIITEALPYSDEIIMTVLDNTELSDIILDVDIPDEFNNHVFQRLSDGSGTVHTYFKSQR